MNLQPLKQWLQAEGFAGVPRWYFLLAVPIFYLATLIAALWKWDSGQPIAVNLENIATLSGGGIFPWLLAFTHLHTEVLHMIFSREVNRREKEKAVAQARAAMAQERAVAQAAEQEQALANAIEQAVTKAVARERAVAQEQAVAQAVEQERSEWLAWFQRNQAHLPKDTEPPPGIARNHSTNDPD